jgi:hypothetical protein
MNTPYFTAILAVTTLAFSDGAIGKNLSKSEYQAAERKIGAEYKSARTSCDFLDPDAREICMAEAKRTNKIAKAKLEEHYKPASKVIYEVSLTKT